MDNNKLNPETYVDLNNENLWDFDTYEDVTFLNANHIHPLKQRELQKIINKIQLDNHVIGLVVFGSSTEFRCNSRSDIDLFVIKDDKSNEISVDITDTTSEIDILFEKNISDRLRRELLYHGVLVYMRK